MSAYPLRHFAQREPKALAQLTRPQVAGRTYAVRAALDLLMAQSDLDGGVGFSSRGALKGELIALENRLQEMDRQAPERPFSLAVAEPDARRRLSAASADLSAVLTGICADAIRAAAGGTQ